MIKKFIKSVDTKQSDIITNILKLHNEGNAIDLDATYSSGKFYKNIQQPVFKMDKYPQTPDTISANTSDIPFPDNSFKCVMYDPPFLFTKGPSKKTKKKGQNIMLNRFSSYETWDEQKGDYELALYEFFRVLNYKGILIVKCQNFVCGGKKHFSHFFTMKKAIEAGFYPKDEFVLHNKSKVTSGKWNTQRHSLTMHSYFIVFQKLKRTKVNYD